MESSQCAVRVTVGNGAAHTISRMWRYSKGWRHSKSRKWSHSGSTKNRVGKLSSQAWQNQPSMQPRKNMDHRASPEKARSSRSEPTHIGYIRLRFTQLYVSRQSIMGNCLFAIIWATETGPGLGCFLPLVNRS